MPRALAAAGKNIRNVVGKQCNRKLNTVGVYSMYEDVSAMFEEALEKFDEIRGSL
jgi:hypothetical protein